MTLLRNTILLACIALTGCAMNVHETGFHDRTVVSNGTEYRYQVYLPHDYTPSQEWPVILFLHGAGERGSDGLAQTQVGLGRAIRLNPERWPAIAVFPQAPDGQMWQGDSAAMAMAALDATVAEFSTDASRAYLTGLSLGGNGTWYLGYNHSERFAAMIAVCGFVQLGDRYASFTGTGGDPYAAIAQQISDKPVWVVHGDADVVVPVEQSRNMVNALQAANADVTYVELPGVNHNSWDAAYADEAMIEWLFAQQR